MTVDAQTIRSSCGILLFTLALGCSMPGAEPVTSSASADTSGSWPSPEIEAMVKALEADTITSVATLSLYNEVHELRIVGVGNGINDNDRAFTIQLTGPNGMVLDTLLTKAAFADSLDAEFFERSGLYALDFDFVRATSLYFTAYIGVDESCYVERMGFFLTYAGHRKGRMIYWSVPDEELNE